MEDIRPASVRRRLKPFMGKYLDTFSATFLIVASMLGTGILTTSGDILALVKSPAAMLGVWIASGMLAWIGAWCYGELAKKMPFNGGEATILRELFSPVLGEIAGWTSFVVGFAACNAMSALALSAYLDAALPQVAIPAKLTACLALLLVTAMHGLLGPVGMRLQTALATAKFSMLALLTLFGLYLAFPGILDQPAAPAEAVRHTASFGAPWGLAMMYAGFSYSGWNAAIYVAGEIRNPERNVKRAMIIGTSIIVALYVAINAVLLSQLPAAQLEGVRPVIAVLVKHMFGQGTSSVFSALVAFALLSSLGVSAFLGPRVLSTMLSWFGRQAAPASHDRSPINPTLIWLQAALSVFMVLTGTFAQILTVMGFLLGLFPILCILGLYRPVFLKEKTLSLKLTHYVFAPVFIAVSSCILILGAKQKPAEVCIALALVALFFFARFGTRRLAKASDPTI